MSEEGSSLEFACKWIACREKGGTSCAMQVFQVHFVALGDLVVLGFAKEFGGFPLSEWVRGCYANLG